MRRRRRDGDDVGELEPLAWQVAHPLVMPVWFIVATEKLPGVVWHSAQGWLVGMWLDGIVVMPE